LQAAACLFSIANPPSLPLSVASVHILAPCAQETIVWARDPGEASESGIHQVDIDLCDAQGNVCVSLRGVAYEAQPQAKPEVPAKPQQLPAASLGQVQVALHEPEAAAPVTRASAKPRGVALA
jgi:hypothetical protein